MSAQIRLERDAYFSILEQTQKSSMDVTPWMEWFLNCLSRAIEGARVTLGKVLYKSRFWESIAVFSLNDRQRIVLGRLLDGLDGKLTTAKWAKLAKCSHDSALRDIQILVAQRILIQNPEGGRSTSYSLTDFSKVDIHPL